MVNPINWIFYFGSVKNSTDEFVNIELKNRPVKNSTDKNPA